MAVKRGRCLCSAVTYEYKGEENRRRYCLCACRRRATSSPLATAFGVNDDRFEFAGEETGVNLSSSGVRRSFCRTCHATRAVYPDRGGFRVRPFLRSMHDNRAHGPLFPEECRH